MIVMVNFIVIGIIEPVQLFTGLRLTQLLPLSTSHSDVPLRSFTSKVIDRYRQALSNKVLIQVIKDA